MMDSSRVHSGVCVEDSWMDGDEDGDGDGGGESGGVVEVDKEGKV